MINTPLGRHIYGEGVAGHFLQTAVGILGSPWLKSPAQGAATSITAAVSPDLESQSGEPRLARCPALRVQYTAFLSWSQVCRVKYSMVVSILPPLGAKCVYERWLPSEIWRLVFRKCMCSSSIVRSQQQPIKPMFLCRCFPA